MKLTYIICGMAFQHTYLPLTCCRMKEVDGHWLIEMSGQEEVVHAAKSELQTLIKDIKYGKREISKPGE